MYRKFFNLAENPFEGAPNPRYFFESPGHEEAVATLQHVTRGRKGAVLLTGPAGVGKTLVGRLAVRGLSTETRSVWIKDTLLPAREMLVDICRGFGLKADSDAAQVDLTALLERFLVSQFRNDAHAVLVADDVHELSSDAVRLLKVLNNLEVDDAKLLQILILERSTPGSRSVPHAGEVFGDRLYRSLELSPLTAEQTAAYVRHRLAQAGENGKVRFSDGALDLIYESTGGVPRSVNQIAEFSLLAAFTASAFEVTDDIVARAVAENPPVNDSPTDHAGQAPEEPLQCAEEDESDGKGRLAIERTVRLARLRAIRLNRVVRRANEAASTIHSAEDRGEKQLARIESVLERICSATDRAVQAEDQLKGRHERFDSDTQQQFAAVASRVQDLIRALDRRILDFDHTHRRARKDETDGEAQLQRVESACREAGTLTETLQDAHRQAVDASEAVRSMQQSLNVTEKRVQTLVTESHQQLERCEDTEKTVERRLESAGQAIQSLAAAETVQERLQATVAEAGGRETALNLAQEHALETLSASEDHYADVVDALERGQQSRNEAAELLLKVRSERSAAEHGQKDAEAVLETLAQRETELRRVESACREAGTLAATLENAHRQAVDASQDVRSTQQSLNATEKRVQLLVTESRQHLERWEEKEKTVERRLESAGQAIQSLAAAETAHERLQATVAEARGRETALNLAQQRAFETLSASEDHFGDLSEALERGQQSRDQAAEILLKVQGERNATEHGRKDAEAVLETLTHRQAELRRLESACRQAGTLAGTLEDAHRQAVGASQDVRSMHQSLNATEKRVQALVAESHQQLERWEDTEKTVDRRLGSAGQAIQSLAAAETAQERLQATVAEARGRETALNLAQQRALETLSASEDHYGDVVDALERGQQSRDEVAEILLKVRGERNAAEHDRKDAEVVLEALTQRKTQLTHFLDDVNTRAHSLEITNRQAEAMIASGREALEKIELNSRTILQTMNQSLADAEQRTERIQRECQASVTTAAEEITTIESRTRASMAGIADESESRAAEAYRRTQQATHNAIEQAALLENANRAAAGNTRSARRLIEQLGFAAESAQQTCTSAQQSRDRLADQVRKANDAREWIARNLDELVRTLPQIQNELSRSGECIASMAQKREQLRTDAEGVSIQLDQLRSQRDEWKRDSTRAAGFLRRSRRHLRNLIQADVRTQSISQQAEERITRLRNELKQADELLADTGSRLEQLADSQTRVGALVEETLSRFRDGELRAANVIERLERKHADVEEILGILRKNFRTALHVSKTQRFANADFEKRIRRLASALYVEKQNADQAVRSLKSEVSRATKAVQEPRALLEEAVRQVPQLQRLAKLLHEIYFKLNGHVPDFIAPEDWERSMDSAAGASRRVLLANSARLRRIVDISRRLFDSTAERLTLLHQANERAAMFRRADSLGLQVDLSTENADEPPAANLPPLSSPDHSGFSTQSNALSQETSAHRVAERLTGLVQDVLGAMHQKSDDHPSAAGPAQDPEAESVRIGSSRALDD